MIAKTHIAFSLLIFFFFFTFVKVDAQSCDIKISGRVIDHHDDEVLEFASVYIQELGKGVVSDVNGYFEFSEICPGKYHFVISHLGCESKTEYLFIEKSGELIFILEHHSQLLEEVEISGQSFQSQTGSIKYTISKDILFEHNGRNLSEILTTIPGVTTLKAGPNLSKPVINGMYGNRITILNNGIPQEGQQWGNDHAPEIDPNTADKISVYKGASAIKYGLQSLGGLVLLEPGNIPNDPHWHGEFNLNGQSNGRVIGFNGAARNSTDIGNVKVTAGFNFSGDRHAPEYFLTNTGNKEISASIFLTNKNFAKIERKLYYSFYQNKIGILRGAHIGNLTDLREAFTRSVPFFTSDKFSYDINLPRQEVDHHLLKLSYKYRVSEEKNILFEGGLQLNKRAEFDVRRGDRDSRPSLNMALFSQYYDFSFNYNKLNEKQSFSAGIQYRNLNNTNIPGTGISPLIPDYLNNIAALYIINKTQILGLDFETGFRGEFRNYYVLSITNDRNIVKENIQFKNWAGNLGVRKKVSNKTTGYLDISYTNRPPEVNELFSDGLHQGVSGLEIGNRDLLPERAFNINNEWTSFVRSNSYLSGSLFINYIQNFIYLQPQDELVLTIRGAFPLFKYIGTDALLKGGSLKFTNNFNKYFQWSAGMSYIHAKNITQSTGLIRIPPLNAFSNVKYTIGKTKWFNELVLGLESEYTAEQKNVPIHEDFINPPASFFLLHSSIRAKFKRKKNNDFEISIRIDNLLNSNYRNYLNRLRYFSNETGRNLFLNFKTNF